MTIALSQDDRRYLEDLAGRPMRPTRWQKAQALLGLAAGESHELVAKRVGIRKEDLASLVDRFTKDGLGGVGLNRSGVRKSSRSGHRWQGKIEKTRGICGGDARIAGTRIPVWQLVEVSDLGASEAQLLLDYPHLKAANLVDAWAYAEAYPDEIQAAIHANQVA